MKKKIVILGCGFGGFSALNYLAHYRRELALTVVDKSREFSFLPGLPDYIGREIPSCALSCPIPELARARGAFFGHAEVRQVDTALKKVITDKGEYDYDYLIIATGSQTTFYGNDSLKSYASTLDSIEDARRIRYILETSGFDSFIIAGGGYTGIETATNVRRFLQRKGRGGRVLIVEKTPDILGPLPDWMKEHVRENLNALQVSLVLNNAIERVEGKQIRLSSGEVFENALLIWTAGVKTAEFLGGFSAERSAQGRIKVDPFLRISESCFIIGDSAQVFSGTAYLRMAVQFAIAQGQSAASNIIRSIERQPLVPYRPVDLGFVIPLANNNSCGCVGGINMSGMVPTFLHYCMCVYRSVGLRSKIAYVKGLLKK